MSVNQKLKEISFIFEQVEGRQNLLPFEGIFEYSDPLYGLCADIAATTILYISREVGDLVGICAVSLSNMNSPVIRVNIPGTGKIRTTMLMFGVRLLKDRDLIEIDKTRTIIPSEMLLDTVLDYLREKKRSLS